MIVKLKLKKKIDLQTKLDLHIKNELQQDKIFEFKSPKLKPFKKEKKESRFIVSEELSQALNQLIIYLSKLDFY